MKKRRRPRSSSRDKLINIPKIKLPVTFEAGHGFVTAVFHIENSTLGMRFESPEQLLTFFTQLMESATIAWPNDPFIRMYIEEDIPND